MGDGSQGMILVPGVMSCDSDTTGKELPGMLPLLALLLFPAPC